MEDENIIGTAYIVVGHEPSYDYIEGGQWLNDHLMPLYIVLRFVKTTRVRVLLVI